MGRTFRYGLLIGLAGFCLALLLQWSGAFLALERTTWRWRVGHFANGPLSPDPIVLIALDQQSLDWGQRENQLSWPWPREAYALILDFCRRSKVKAVAFDLLFSESSLYGVDDDLVLAAALRRAGTVVGSAALGSGSATRWPGVNDWFITEKPPVNSEQFVRVSLPVSELADAFAALGNVRAVPDSDGVFRSAALVTYLNDQPVPSLALAIYLSTHRDVRIRTDDAGYNFSGQHVPVGSEGRVVPRYRGASATFPTLSAAAVIQSELLLQEGEQPLIDPGQLQGAYVLFGLSAPGLFDLRPTPLDGVFPGMEIHATLLDNLLADDFLKTTPRVALNLWAFGFALVSGLLICRCRNTAQTVVLFALLIPLPLVAGYLAYGSGYVLSVAFPGGAVIFALIGGVLFNYATEGRKKREIRKAFNQYLHPTVIEQLVDNPEKLKLGGEKRELSIFFSDLEGFTSIAEGLEPEALTSLLNAYLTEMTDIILDTGGTIDKYEGDAIIAFWNAPLDQPDHAKRAVQAALACQARLAELRPEFTQHYGYELSMRIGINTGEAVVGNMGSTRRFDYTMLGDAVNLAARLEGVNKVFATRILISEATANRLDPALPIRAIATVAVVGRKEPVTIYEPLAQEEAGADVFDQALACYRSGNFAEAQSLFATLAADDATAAVYVRRCVELAAEAPVDWSGVWVMSGK